MDTQKTLAEKLQERIETLTKEYREGLLWLNSLPQYRRLIELEGALKELEALTTSDVGTSSSSEILP